MFVFVYYDVINVSDFYYYFRIILLSLISLWTVCVAFEDQFYSLIHFKYTSFSLQDFRAPSLNCSILQPGQASIRDEEQYNVFFLSGA